MITFENSMPDRIISACLRAHQSPIFVQKHLLTDNKSRLGDVFLTVGKAINQKKLSFIVTSRKQQGLIAKAVKNSGFALSIAEDMKDEQYGQNYSEIGFQFILLTFALFWRFWETFRQTLKRIATQAEFCCQRCYM